MISPTIDAGDGLPLTIPRLVKARAEGLGERVFLVCDDEKLTYREAEVKSRRLGLGLLATGAGKGTHIGLLFPNGPDFAVAFLAAARLGAVAVPFSTFSTEEELRGLLTQSDVEVLLSAPAHRSHRYDEVVRSALPGIDLADPSPILVPAAPNLRRIYFSGPPLAGSDPAWSIGALDRCGEVVSDGLLAAAEDDVVPADHLVIVHTSGSTSRPKGVVHTHGALLRHLNNLNEIRRYGRDEVLFSNSPFFWIGGLAYSMLGTLLAGGRLVCSNSPSAAEVLDVLERERPTMVNGYAASVAHLAQDRTFDARDLSSIRRGNLYPIMPEDVRPKDPELRHNMLGMTEAGSVCLVSEDEGELPERRRGSFGKPAPGFEARVVDVDSGHARGPGEVGELVLRSPFLMEGYYGHERHEVFTPDGWFSTGDLFTVDDEGFFYFKGRRGDLIKTAGASVSPREVEAVLRDATDGRPCHVFGLDDPERGQIVVAVVVAPDDESVDVEALRRVMAERLSSYKVPRRIVRLAQGEIPILSSGKLDVRQLREVVRAL